MKQNYNKGFSILMSIILVLGLSPLLTSAGFADCDHPYSEVCDVCAVAEEKNTLDGDLNQDEELPEIEESPQIEEPIETEKSPQIEEPLQVKEENVAVPVGTEPEADVQKQEMPTVLGNAASSAEVLGAAERFTITYELGEDAILQEGDSFPVDTRAYQKGEMASLLPTSAYLDLDKTGKEKDFCYFEGWLLSGGDDTVYNPGSKVEVTGNMHFVAKYFDKNTKYFTARFQLYNSPESPFVLVYGPSNGEQTTPGPDIFSQYGAIVHEWKGKGWLKDPVPAGDPLEWHNENMYLYAYETLDDVEYVYTVQFIAGENGSFGEQGSTVTFWNLPETTLFEEIEVPEPIPDPGYRTLPWVPTLPDESECIKDLLSPGETMLTFRVDFTSQPIIVVTPENLTIPYGDAEEFTATVEGDDVEAEVLAAIKAALKFDRTDSANKNIGTYTIFIPQATQESIAKDFSDYEIVFETGLLTIEGREVTVKADNKSVSYNSDPPAYTASVIGALNRVDELAILNALDELVCSYQKGDPADDYDIIVSGPEVFGNYILNYEKGTLKVSALVIDLSQLNVVPAQKIFGENDPVSYTITGWPKGVDLSQLNIVVEKRPDVVVEKGKHTYVPEAEDVRKDPYLVTITVTPDSSFTGSYNIVGDPLKAELTILPKRLTLSASNLYVNFGDPRPEQSVLNRCFEYRGFAFDQGEEVLDRGQAQTDYTNTWAAGVYKDALTMSVAEKNEKNNYIIPPAVSDVIVGAKAVDFSSVSLDAKKIYGNNDPTDEEYIAALINWPVNVGEPGIDYTLTFNRTKDPGETVNNGEPYKVVITVVSDNENYTVQTQPGLGYLTIEKKHLNAYIKNLDDVTFNTQAPNLLIDQDYGYTGFVQNQKLGIDDSLNKLINNGQLAPGTLVVEYSIGDPVGEYLVKLTGGQADNYTLGNAQTTFQVVALPVDFTALEVKVNDSEKYYTQADPMFSLAFWPQGEGVPIREHFDITYLREYPLKHDVGDYQVQATITPKDEFKDNYRMKPDGEKALAGTLEILPISVVVTPEPAGKTYGDSDPRLSAKEAFDSYYQGSRNYPIDQVVYGVGRNGGENVGTYTMFITTADKKSENLADIQKDNPNYVISVNQVIDGFDISPATTMLVANSFTITAGDTVPPLTAYVHPSYPLRGGDTTLNYSVFTTTDGATVGKYPIKINLGNNPNYIVRTTPGVLTVNAAVPVEPPVGPVTPLVVPTTPPVTPPTPTEPEAVEVIPDEPTPIAATTVVGDEETPLAAPEPLGAWALVNLVCAILSLLIGVVLLIGFFRRNKKAQDENEYEYTKMGYAQTEDEPERNPKSGRGWRTISVLIGIASPIVFLLTENIFNPMVLVDTWTLLMVVLLALQIVSTVLLYRARNQEEDQEREGAENLSMAQ